MTVACALCCRWDGARLRPRAAEARRRRSGVSERNPALGPGLLAALALWPSLPCLSGFQAALGLAGTHRSTIGAVKRRGTTHAPQSET